MRLTIITYDISLSTGKTIRKQAITSKNTFNWRKVKMQPHLPMHTIVLVTATCMYVTLKKPNSIIRKPNR